MPARKVSKRERIMNLSKLSAAERAKCLASISAPLVAELLEAHAEACGNQSGPEDGHQEKRQRAG